MTPLALRGARSTNGVSRRHGEVARSHVAAAVRRRGRRRPHHPRHQRRARAHLAGPGDEGACSTVTSASGGSTTADDPATWAGGRRHPRRRALGRPHRPAGTASSSSSASGPPTTGSVEARTSATPRPRPRASTPTRLTDRLRPPTGHLQAPAPAHPRPASRRRACSPATRRCSSSSPGKAHPLDEEAKRHPPAHLRVEGRARRRRPGRLPRGLRPVVRRAVGGRVRRLGQRPAVRPRRPAAPAA